ncbi:MAG: hypothetical protein R2836_01705 [Chitinophagales bacterium]
MKYTLQFTLPCGQYASNKKISINISLAKSSSGACGSTQNLPFSISNYETGSQSNC